MIATRSVAIVKPNDGVPLFTPAGQILVKIEADETDDAYAVLVMSVPPQASTSPLHTHPFGETFYVLAGSFEFSTLGERGVETLKPAVGGVVNIPGDAPHAFKNVGTTTGSLLVVASPRLVEFLREIDGLAEDGAPVDLVKVAPVLEKYRVRPVADPNGL